MDHHSVAVVMMIISTVKFTVQYDNYGTINLSKLEIFIELKANG